MSIYKGIPNRNVLDLRAHKVEKPAPKPAPVGFIDKRNRKTRRKGFSFLQTVEASKQTAVRKSEPTVKKQTDEIRKVVAKNEQAEKKKDEKTKRKFYFPLIPLKSLIGFASVAFVFALGVFFIQTYQHASASQGRVLGAVTTAFSSLEDAQTALVSQDADSAEVSLAVASKNFSDAYTEIQSVKKQFIFLNYIPGIHGQLQSGEHAMLAGQEITELGTTIQGLIEAGTSPDESGYIAFMKSYNAQSKEIQDSIDTIAHHLSKIDETDIPEAYRDTFISLRSNFDDIRQIFKRANSVFAVLYDVLGFTKPKDFLLVFQNNQELRPTGGFIGSIARVSVFNGAIEQLTVPKGGSYDISGQVKEKYKAPKPMQIVNPYLSFQDANWFADFPTSAEKILELYYDAGNDPTDGIISFTPDVLVSLLELTGPIQVDDGGQTTVTSDNFLRVTRESIEEKKDQKSTQPKKIIADLMPKLLDSALELPAEDQLRFISILDESIRMKRIFMYASDPDLQNRILTAGMSGALPIPSSDDYLALVTANIGGGKTDRVINQHVTIETTFQDNLAHNTLTIIREHEGVPSDEFSGTVNLAYMQAFVPVDSVLKTAEGFYDVPASWYVAPPKETPVDTDLENAENNTIVHEKTNTRILADSPYTILGNWMRVEPESSTASVFTYTIPNKSNDDSWVLQLVRQPGQEQVSFTWVVDAGRKISQVLTAEEGAHISIDGTRAEVSFDLVEDTLVGIVLK